MKQFALKCSSLCLLISFSLLSGCGKTEYYEQVTYEDELPPPTPDHVIKVPELSLSSPVNELIQIIMPESVKPASHLSLTGTLLPPDTNPRETEILLILIYRSTSKKKGVARNAGGPVMMENNKYPFEYFVDAPEKPGKYLVEISCSCPKKLRPLASGILIVKE